MDLKDIFRLFHPKTEYTFFSSTHGIFSRIDHKWGHKLASTNTTRQRLYHAFFLITMPETWSQQQEKIWKEHKYMEVKEHATKEWMGQPGN